MTLASQTRKSPFVLVHGAFHGGWCWKPIADQLRSAGHDVYTPTQTGLGERKHLMSADISMETFVLDVLNVILSEDLRSEEHTSELQSLMSYSYAVFCLK